MLKILHKTTHFMLLIINVYHITRKNSFGI